MSRGTLMAPWAVPPVSLPWGFPVPCVIREPWCSCGPQDVIWPSLCLHSLTLLSLSSFVGSSVEWLSIILRRILRFDSWQLPSNGPLLSRHWSHVQPQGEGGVTLPRSHLLLRPSLA